MKPLFFLSFTSALLMAGCEKERSGGKGEGNLEPPDILSGQIFLINSGSETKKLSLVSIKVLNQEGVKLAQRLAEETFVNMVAGDSNASWPDFYEKWATSCFERIFESASTAEIKSDADGRFLFSSTSDEILILADSTKYYGARWMNVYDLKALSPSGIMLTNENEMLAGTSDAFLDVWKWKARFEHMKLNISSQKRNQALAKEIKRFRELQDDYPGLKTFESFADYAVRKRTQFPFLQEGQTIKDYLEKKKLIDRQRKPQPTVKQAFRPKAVSDIAAPDFNEIDVKELALVVDVPPSHIGRVFFRNDAMKSALAGMNNLPKTMQSRCDPKKRVARLRAGGGKDFTETAIIRGLNWLKKTQAADGSWGGSAKGEDGKMVANDRYAMTGMALLCFLGHCELHNSSKFGSVVQKAINFLTSIPPEKMALGNQGCYAHPIRTFALCEAFTMTKIKKLELYAKRASEHVVKGQNENGGWAYGYGKGSGAHVDLSVTGWNIQALKAASLTGIYIDGLDEAMDKAVEYTKKCQDAAGKFAYRIGSGGKPSLTGTGVLCLQIWKNAKSQEAQKGLEWIIANQATEWKDVNVYEWYYHAQACFQATGVSGGQKYWRAWNKNFQQIVCSAQESDGHWPHGAHFHGDSDIFRTTLTILMLEVYYSYMPTG